MTDNPTERIENVRQITAKELQAGGFVFQLDGATDDEAKAFEAVVEEAKNTGKNLILTPNVKVVDLKMPVKQPEVPAPVTPTPETTPAEKKEEPAAPTEPAKTEPTPTTKETPQPQAQTPVQPQFVMPQQYFQYGQNPYGYNPVQQAMPYQYVPVMPPQGQPVTPVPYPYPVTFPTYGIMPQQAQPTEKKE